MSIDCESEQTIFQNEIKKCNSFKTLDEEIDFLSQLVLISKSKLKETPIRDYIKQKIRFLDYQIKYRQELRKNSSDELDYSTYALFDNPNDPIITSIDSIPSLGSKTCYVPDFGFDFNLILMHVMRIWKLTNKSKEDRELFEKGYLIALRNKGSDLLEKNNCSLIFKEKINYTIKRVDEIIDSFMKDRLPKKTIETQENILITLRNLKEEGSDKLPDSNFPPPTDSNTLVWRGPIPSLVKLFDKMKEFRLISDMTDKEFASHWTVFYKKTNKWGILKYDRVRKARNQLTNESQDYEANIDVQDIVNRLKKHT